MLHSTEFMQVSTGNISPLREQTVSLCSSAPCLPTQETNPFLSHGCLFSLRLLQAALHQRAFLNLRLRLSPESPLFSRSLALSESSVTQYKDAVDPSTNSTPTHILQHLCASASWPEQSVFRTYWQKQHWPLNCSYVLQLIIYKKGLWYRPL